MPPKRRKRSPAPEQGLAPGESLKRYLVPVRNTRTALWSWVGSEVSQPADITQEHHLIACGLSARNNNTFCKNKYVVSHSEPPEVLGPMEEKINTAEDDFIVISDDEDKCSKKSCKENPNCLNYLGQDKWECEEDALRDFLNSAALGQNPMQDNRDPDRPVGLKNLGATCYANASLQVWFRNLAFRNGVYQCQPTEGMEKGFQVTFTGLQRSSRSIFNPTSLIESLQLRTAEQQDAQEFSKLFMSHLDAEFKMQSAPHLRSLISDQFQGTQVYGTVCDTCQYRSEKSTDFLELEIRFEGNSRLEDCIAAQLQDEKLTGDNQYRCPQCNDLRDATRYSELRQLPPVLHFSLLRFIYDFSTMERKKSKHNISFPTTLDMNQFLKYRAEGIAQVQDAEDNVYELGGILLHKGTSAYHGHYEAQAYDTEKQSWFQFNDEVVTKIKQLGDKRGPKDTSIETDDDKSLSKQGKRSAKRRRVMSDDEVESSQLTASASRTISSKDAYMLVYVRKSYHSNSCESSNPPQRALELVHALNKSHEEDCAAFVLRERAIKEQFLALREQIMDLYRTWNAASVIEDCVILSQRWLQTWLSERLVHSVKPPPLTANTGPEEQPQELTNDSPKPDCDDTILCTHKKLDPVKAKNMKRIKRSAYQKMVELTGCRYDYLSSPSDVCEECVLVEFKERLYSIEHPKLVREFDQISEVEEESLGYWISKKWLRDWRLLKPKMHNPSEDDPSPESLEYKGHVRCEHDALSINSLNRRKISEKAVQFLQRLFPSWDPIRDDVEPCVVCRALVHIVKEDQRELTRRAEEEKVLLRTMYEGVPFTEGEDTYAIIPTSFYKSWLSWLNNPAESARVNHVDNASLLCDHDLLIIDPKCPLDMEVIATVIRLTDWEVLKTLYDCGSLISLKMCVRNSNGKVYESDIPVCEECRHRRKTEWVSADIIIQLHRGKSSDTSTSRQPIATFSNTNGTRQSKRLRQARETERRRFAVTKKTTVKDIKLKIQEGFKIPTICQRLFFRGQELDDNGTTVGALEIFADEVLELREQTEVHDVDIDSDEEQPAKRQRREQRDAERGFGGTLLSGQPSEREFERDHTSSSREDAPHGFAPAPTEKVCTACTLVNAYDAVACTICDTLFA